MVRKLRSDLAILLSSLVFPFAVFAISNPILPNGGSCGLDIALVLDSSGSITDLEMAQMKGAFHAFVNTFLPATPTQFSVIDFDQTARVLVPFTSNVSAINAAINTPTSGGTTNWQDALSRAQGVFDPRASVPNLIIIATDGLPNVVGPFGTIPSDYSDITQMSRTALLEAVRVADAIKLSGTRILALGIGTGGNANFIQNIEAISGPRVDEGIASDVITTDFSTLAADLAAIARQQCGGTITVTKIIDHDGDLRTTGDQLLASDWNFTVAGALHRTGEADRGKTAPQSVHSGTTVSVVETGGPRGYSFISARCVNVNHGNAPVGTPSEEGVSGISVTAADIISCVFYSKPGPSSLNMCPACPVGYEVKDNRCIFVGCPVTGC